MKYHIKWFLRKKYPMYLHSSIRRHSSKGICYTRRKSIQARPLIKFASSTAGSVERSKLPKISDQFKTTARFKDFVAIVWRLFQDKKASPILASKKILLPLEPKLVADDGANKSTTHHRFSNLTPVPSKNVEFQGVKLDKRTLETEAASAEDKTVSSLLFDNVASPRTDCDGEQSSSDSKPKVVKAESSSFSILAQRLPVYLMGIGLNLPWGNILKQKSTAAEIKSQEKMSTATVATAKVESEPKPKEETAEEDDKEKPIAVEERIEIAPKPRVHKTLLRESNDSRTRYLMRSVATASSLASRSMRLQEFCKHLCENPAAKSLAVKERAIPLMLRLQIITHDPSIQAHINEALAMLGYSQPLPGHGIRILSIDGGGTRGIMAIEILRMLENITKQPIHRLFDFICGVSTGAIISILLGAMKASMDECEDLYKKTSGEVFNQNTLWGTSSLVLSHSYYDTEAWEKVLRKNIGEISLIHTARDASCPKIASVSTIVSEARLQNFIFRNYDYPHRNQSYFQGSYTPELWEAVRASAAAPGYFQEYKLGKHVHQDGGVMTNNPAALAIHECRHLWPGEPIQCLVSIGNGRFEPRVPLAPTYSSLKTKILRIVDSATDTEMVHTILGDLLPPNRYFRFNPYLSESISLDEIRPEKFKQLEDDALMYIRKNEVKMHQAAQVLMEPKSQFQRARDAIKHKFMTYI